LGKKKYKEINQGKWEKRMDIIHKTEKQERREDGGPQKQNLKTGGAQGVSYKFTKDKSIKSQRNGCVGHSYGHSCGTNKTLEMGETDGIR